MIVWIWIFILAVLLYLQQPTREGMDCNEKTLVYKHSGMLENLKENNEEINKKIEDIQKKLTKTSNQTNDNTDRMKNLSREISNKIKAKQTELNNA